MTCRNRGRDPLSTPTRRWLLGLVVMSGCATTQPHKNAPAQQLVATTPRPLAAPASDPPPSTEQMPSQAVSPEVTKASRFDSPPPASPKEPTAAEVEELLLAAQAGDSEQLLEVIELQAQEERPWEEQSDGPVLSAQGPSDELGYDETVQSALYQAYAIDPDGKAIGRPNRGHLKDGVPLPYEPDLYTIRSKHASYASSHTALQVVTAFRAFRRESGYSGKVIIADISAKSGGSYRTHHSHQTGRDLDILMPLMPGTKRWGHDIDWDTTWALVRAFLETKEVEYIFLDYKIQNKLHAAALRAKEHPDKLASLISWPVGKWNKTIIRDSPGHWAHFHVRIKCGPTETRCRSFH